MRVTFLALAALLAAFTTAKADWIASQTQMADLSKAASSAFVEHNASVIGVNTSSTTPLATVRFNSYLGSFGQDFSSAHNWSAYNIVSFYITNKSFQNVTLKFITQFNSDPSNYTNAFTGTFTAYANSSRYFVCYLNTDDPLPYGLKYQNPVLSADAWEVFSGGGVRNLASTWHWRLSYQGSTPNQVDISDMRLIRQSLNFTGIADAFGQYTDKVWPTKIKSSSDFATQFQAEHADNQTHAGTGETLGTNALANPVTTYGKWTVVTYPNGQKFLQHPDGKLFWSLGLNAVMDSLPTRIQDRTNYFQYLPPTTGFFASCYSALPTPAGTKTCYSFRRANLMMKYGSSYMPGWTSMVKSRLASWGFNTLGIDCNSALMNSTIPFTCELSTSGFGTRISPPDMKWGSLPDPYASAFATWCQQNFQGTLSGYVGSQNLMGAFVDNELSWGTMDSNDLRYNVVLGVLRAPATQPAKVALVNQLTLKYGTIAALNQSWGTGFTAFSSLLSSTSWKPTNYSSAMSADFQTFVRAYASKYFSTVRSALRTDGLKSLYLGSRFADYTDEVVSGAASNVDVLSFNVYRFTSDVPWAYYASLPKPVLISEFGFTLRAEGTFGGPASMPGTTGRAFRIQEFLNHALTQPNIVGVHYYCYADQPITGRYSDYENGGFGMVDTADEPYSDSVNAFRTFTSNMYAVRGGGTSSGGGGGGGGGGGTGSTGIAAP